MSAEAASSSRRGWCPGVRRPMITGDGLLVRIHPPAGRLTSVQARMIAQAAKDHGNGHLDVTARGNLQIRGVREDSYGALVECLDEGGLLEPEGDGPHRLCIVSPLAGLDPQERFDPLSLSEAVEAAAPGNLPAKICIAIDGGGSILLESVGADLHVTATDDLDAVAIGLASSGGIRWIGKASLESVPSIAGTLLSSFVEMRQAGRTDARRLLELDPGLIRELEALVELQPASPPCSHANGRLAGVIDLGSGGQAVLAALPFGRCESQQLTRTADWSRDFGNDEIRLSFTRGLLLPGLAEQSAQRVADEARFLGFILDESDPRLSIQACPGKPACAGAFRPASEDAVRIAQAASHLFSQGASIHVSGCGKGCAHPSPSDLTLVGREDGCYGVIVSGSSREKAATYLTIEDIMIRLSSLNAPGDMARAFRKDPS
ncbi:precorrin-3B synthase [Microvirga flavescens]|uniref:precorrin-3B synthase n=1 Tax=Microvirga flavescens TaxID=2249811 RepID=UPI000DDA5D86|nr:precorrin-3B synthase [Microvirga flavescens]